jgi:hypothetical protein
MQMFRSKQTSSVQPTAALDWWLVIPTLEGVVVPKPESTCDVFGINDLASGKGWGGGRVDSAGDYVWNLWRPYKCCRRRGQVFLFDIDWIAYPP